MTHPAAKINWYDPILKKLLYNRAIDESTGCWLHHGSIDPNSGYGIICHHQIRYRVHRLSAHIYLGFDLDSELQINHKSICPNRNCWNPDHIYVGTQKENMIDRANSLTHCPQGHIKSGYNRVEHRRADGVITIECRECSNTQQRERRRLRNESSRG